MFATTNWRKAKQNLGNLLKKQPKQSKINDCNTKLKKTSAKLKKATEKPIKTKQNQCLQQKT